MIDLDLLQTTIGVWQRATFPQGTPAGVLAHLRKELDELEASGAPEEAADVFILLCGFANQRGFSLAAAVTAKFAELQTREWGAPGPDGVIEHIRS